jgi:hypothetical protein
LLEVGPELRIGEVALGRRPGSVERFLPTQLLRGQIFIP